MALVLLVACSNVANLLLARGTSRARELALRAALGASTWRLMRALLAECLGARAGRRESSVSRSGWLTLRILAQLGPTGWMSLGLGDVQLDPTVLAFTFGLSLVTALLFGAAPAMQLVSSRFGDALRHGASGVVRGGAGARVRKLLVAAQMALSVILLVSAGLLVRSFIHLQNVDVGFDTANLFTAQLSLPRGRYQAPASRDCFVGAASGSRREPARRCRRHAGLPAAAAFHFDVGPHPRDPRGHAQRGRRAPTVGFNFVRPNYFSTLGIRLREGRTFTDDEVRSGGVVVVNRAAAQRFWPEGNAVGSEVKRGPELGNRRRASWTTSLPTV